MKIHPVNSIEALDALLARTQTRQGVPSGGIAWRCWGQGPALVLLHGSGGSWTHWVRNIDVLSRTHTVWVPDLPGHGTSADLGDRSYLSLGKRLVGDLQHLVPEPYVLVGFSFGSMVAEAMALLCPDRVRHLLLIRGTFHGAAPSFPAGLRGWKSLTPELEREVHRHNLGVLMLYDPQRIDELAVDIHAANVRGARVRPGDFSLDGLENSLERLSVPVTMVRGQFDALGGEADVQRQVAIARCPGADFHVVPRAGHWVAYEAPDFIHQTIHNLETQHHVNVS